MTSEQMKVTLEKGLLSLGGDIPTILENLRSKGIVGKLCDSHNCLIANFVKTLFTEINVEVSVWPSKTTEELYLCCRSCIDE